MTAARTIEVPVLHRGGHAHPRRGACLLELYTTLRGGAWTDRPAGLDPVFATACRAVNDRTSDAGRAALLPLVPWLPAHLDATPQLGAALAALAAGHARLGDDEPADAAARTVRRAVRALAHRPDADDALRRFLREAIDLARHAAGRPPMPAEPPAPQSPPATLPVLVETRVPDDSLSAYLSCRAELTAWPEPLARAWSQAVGSPEDPQA